MAFPFPIAARDLPTGPDFGVIAQSCLFDEADSPVLFANTMNTPTDQDVYTFSIWFRLNAITQNRYIASAGPESTSTPDFIRLNSADKLEVRFGGTTRIVTSRVFRDTTSWYHMVLACDYGAAGSDKARLYINGVEETEFDTDSRSSITTADQKWNTTARHLYSRFAHSNVDHFDGHLAEIVFIDGQQLDPTSFGKFDANGVWIPRSLSGLTYGNNGHRLDFSNGAALGADVSGNGNDFGTSGLASSDQVNETPTRVYPKFSTLTKPAIQPSKAGRRVATGGYWSDCLCDMAFPTSGKWYFETLVGNRASSYYGQGFLPAYMRHKPSATRAAAIYYNGTGSATAASHGDALGVSADSEAGYYDGSASVFTVKEPDNTDINGTADLYIVHALDLDNQRWWVGTAFVGDGSVTWWGPGGSGADPTTPATGFDISSWLANFADPALTFAVAPNNVAGAPATEINFGDSAFAYAAPSGFSTLSTANLPEPAIVDGRSHFAARAYTGAGSGVGAKSITDLLFPPDAVWLKNRDDAENHVLQDTLRGASVFLQPDVAGAEGATGGGDVSSFDANGFTLSYNNNRSNAVGDDYAAWSWLEAAGVLDIVGITGTGVAHAEPHNLGVKPGMMVLKNRPDTPAGGQGWKVYLDTPNMGAGRYLDLDSTASSAAHSGMWNDTEPTATHFTVGTHDDVNANGDAIIAYLFAAVPGFSAFGEYVGNGNADGPFIYTGFRPAFILIKEDATDDWVIYDTARDPANPAGRVLVAHTGSAEFDGRSSGRTLDMLASGFKLRTSNATINANTARYFFAAFAENPLGGSTVYPARAR